MTVGDGADPVSLNVVDEAVVVEVDGQVVDTATGAAIQGHPGQALADAANSLAGRGLAIEPG